MHVHYLQHVSFEGLGYIETWLENHGHRISATRFYEPDSPLPTVARLDALIVMGGPMSIYDDAQYPWLQQEKAFIKDCIGAGKKVLGICLGAQLIADCLGAKVNRAAHKEIGWYPVVPANECGPLSWCFRLFGDNPVVFHWHGDKFDIPHGSHNLLSSEANTNQAFYYNQNVLGLQFHIEVTMDTIAQMLKNGSSELVDSAYIQHADQIRNGTKYVGQCNEIMEAILDEWIKS